MTLPKPVRLSEVREDPDALRHTEAAYRRGCHQTAARIAVEIERMENLTAAVAFTGELSDVLGEFRHDHQPHLALLDEAIRKVRDT